MVLNLISKKLLNDSRRSPKFGWINFNINFLADLYQQLGLNLKVLDGNQHSSLVKIVKK